MSHSNNLSGCRKEEKKVKCENMKTELTIQNGINDGFPILLGYFSTAVAFGLICRNININFLSSSLLSVTSFAGSGQFLTINLFATGALLPELFISVMLINFRYVFMGLGINEQLDSKVNFLQRCLIAFGTTDEVFSVATLKKRKLNFKYMAALEFTSYTGWVSGTITGYLIGTFLPAKLQLAMGVTLYAMFASLLAGEWRKSGSPVLIIGGISAIINSILIVVFKFTPGWSFIIAMLSATFIGSYFIKEEENE